MKITQTVILVALLAIGLGCGYSKPANTPTTPATMPTITQLNPASATSGSAAFMLEVDGASFASNAVINFNHAAQTGTTWVNASTVKVMIPATAIMNSGTVPVTVTNPGTAGGIYGGGTSAVTSAPMNFTVD